MIRKSLCPLAILPERGPIEFPLKHPSPHIYCRPCPRRSHLAPRHIEPCGTPVPIVDFPIHLKNDNRFTPTPCLRRTSLKLWHCSDPKPSRRTLSSTFAPPACFQLSYRVSAATLSTPSCPTRLFSSEQPMSPCIPRIIEAFRSPARSS